VQPGPAGTILFIEEDARFRRVVAEFLRKQGFNVHEAADGPLALDLFQTHEPEIDVIVLDVNLPRLPGWEVLKELPRPPAREILRQFRRIRPGVKIILTSTSSQQSVWTALGEPPWAFLQKPYRLSALIDILRGADLSEVNP
jgi:CheY-like chemotaxis protein